ncbi:hypothetical protein PTKIN_Ptkin01aG0075400 [Pterospermum kingtungense]
MNLPVADSSHFSNMGVFYQEDQPHQSKRCKFLATLLKEAFSNCHTFIGSFSSSGPDEEHSTSDMDDESEVVVSEIRSKAMEKMKRRPSVMAESFSWVVSPSTGELYITSKQAKPRDKDDEHDELFPVETCFSFCSSAVSKEAFLLAKTDCSSLNKTDFQDLRPFGLCRKVVLLPPLPKSPSEPWTWRKGTGLAKTPYISS